MSKIPVKNVVSFLFNNIQKIKTVEDWAHASGYSKSYFLRQIREYYGLTPEYILRRIRLVKISEQLHKNPDKIYYAIALDVGLVDDNSLCYFVKKHLEMKPSVLKRQVRSVEGFRKFVNSMYKEIGIWPQNYEMTSKVNHKERLVA